MKKAISFIVLGIILSSCEMKPSPIEYGVDLCHFCSMTIVDSSHSSEFMTSKGKSFKFDSIECMYRELKSESYNTSMILVSDYQHPGNMLLADTAHYLISEEIPSPMGANLSAFSDSTEMAQFVTSGVFYRWQTLELN